LNNQKAVIKVGSEEPFATNASGGQITAGTGGSPAAVSNPTITYTPFFSGIALDVTPQIDDQDGITLQVHSMVNNITVKDKLAIIGSAGTADRLLPFAVNSINETDNVVKTKDGQVIVIGGLMTESAEDNRSKIPGAGDAPVVGSLFKKGSQSSIKRELVILLKPTVVKDDSAWTNDINETQGRIEGLSATQAPTEKN
jgi:MSHA biogenesis protein MshL